MTMTEITWQDDLDWVEAHGFIGGALAFRISNCGTPAHPVLILTNHRPGFTDSVRVESIDQGKSLANWILANTP